MTGLEIILLAALVGACVVALLRWNEVHVWLNNNKTVSHNIGIIIKTELGNGNVGVCTGLFNKNGKISEVTGWKCESMDSGLSNKFGSKNIVRVTV